MTGLGREPQPADHAQALVDGFHVAYFGSAVLIAVAYFGSAVLIAVAFVVLLLLLRRQDVVAVGEREVAMTAAG